MKIVKFHALGIALWLSLFAIGTSHADPLPVRILPLGDSITAGSITDVPGSYRNNLQTQLTTDGFVVDFIGNEQDSATENPSLSDRDHQGISGIQINGIRNSLPIWLKTVEDPDVILVHAGTNDFGAGASPAVVLDRTRNLIRELSQLRPHAKLLVASLILRTDIPTAAANQAAYATALPTLVSEEFALGRQVYFVDMHTALEPADLIDGLHPNATGYGKMATVWQSAINGVITPAGTNDAPQIARVEARENLTSLKVFFSKPVQDLAADPANFSITGGVSVTAAALDSSKRVITLTTETQTAGAVLTLTVNGVKDRTTAENEIAPNSQRPFICRPLMDGSFEEGGTPWTASGIFAVEDNIGYSAANATHGVNFLIFNGDDQANNGRIEQVIPTEPGRRYRLHFDMGVAGSQLGTQKLRLSITGTSTILSHTEMLVNPDNGRDLWTTKALDFIANSATSTLVLEDASTQTTAVDLLVDDVRIELPENNDGAPSLLVNGGFETGDIVAGDSQTVLDGWSATGRAFGYLSTPPGYVPSEGSRLAVFNGGNNSFDGVISQSFATEVGKTYLLALDLGITGGAGKRQALSITLAGDTLSLNWQEEITATGTAPRWIPRGYTFVADSTTTTLTLSDASAPLGSTLTSLADLLVDKVRVIEASESTLTIASEPTEAGAVAIDVSQADTTGNINGTTSFTRTYADGSTVDLTAPLVSGSYVFKKWRQGSLDLTTDRKATVEISSDETITAVYELNTAPTAANDTYLVERDLALVIVAEEGVLANDTDPEDTPLTATVVTGPTYGQLVLNEDGSFTYTPNAGNLEPDSFTYMANDGLASSSPVTVQLTIEAPRGGLLANGSFEVGSPVEFGPLHGWTIVSGDPFGYPNNSFSGATYLPTDGIRLAVFNGGSNDFTDAISQTFATVPGQRYLLEFDLGITGVAGRQQRMNISLTSGESSWNWQEGIVAAGGNTTIWQPKIFAFIAAAEQTTLTFSDASASLPLAQTTQADMMLDHVRVNQGSQRTLTINSQINSVANSGLEIMVSPADVNSASSGTTPLSRAYLDGDVVTLSTPATSGTGVFQKWVKNGMDFSANPEITFTIAGDMTLTASYGSNSPPLAVDDTYPAESGSTLVVNNANFALLANDTDMNSDDLTATLVGTPANGVAAINADGTFSYTPNSGFTGTDTFTYLANDGELNSDPATVTITVVPRTGILIANGSFEVGAQDEDGYSDLDYWAVTFTGTYGPAGYIEDQNIYATYTPTQGERLGLFNGGDNNYTGKISQIFTTIPGETYVIEFDLGISGQLNRQQKMEVAVNNAAASTWNETITSAGPSTNKWEAKSYTFVASATETTLTFRDASDSGALNTDMMLDNVRVYLLDLNDAPVFTSNPLIGSGANEDVLYSGTLAGTASDPDTGDTLTFAKQGGPAWLEVANDGTLSGTPTNSDVGLNEFTVRVSDGSLFADTTLQITVLNANDAPAFTSNPIIGAGANEDVLYTGTLAGTASDPDTGDTLTFAKQGGPAWLEVANDGTLSGTPTNSDVGLNEFTVRVSDGSLFADATLQITVIAAPTNDLDDWLVENEITDGLNVDTDFDGISNLIEYIIGGDPAGRMDADLLPTAELVTADPDNDSVTSDYLLFSHRRTNRAAGNSSVAIKVEWNTDLGSAWANAAETANVVILNSPAQEGVEMVHVYIPRSLAPDGKLFARMVGSTVDSE